MGRVRKIAFASSHDRVRVKNRANTSATAPYFLFIERVSLSGSRTADTDLAVRGHYETPWPGRNRFRGKEMMDALGQSAPAGLGQAHQQQPVMAARPISSNVGKVQILRNEEPTGGLSRVPDP